MGMGPQPETTAAEGAMTTIPASTARAGAAGGGGSYAVLQCGEDSAYVRDAYGGYFNVFRALLEEGGERWRVYRAVRGELPTEDEAAGIDGFVVSGSCSDAHADDPWILALLGLIRRQHAAGKRVLGVCFGHQVRAISFSVAWLAPRRVSVRRVGRSFQGRALRWLARPLVLCVRRELVASWRVSGVGASHMDS